MVAFNKIRNGYRDEIEALKPLLRAAYQTIYDYQLRRTADNEITMRQAMTDAAAILRLFIGHIPASKAKYIQALQREAEMSASDLIMCFDQAVYELHFWTLLQELGIKRGQWVRGRRPWSKELRALLDERQQVDRDNRTAGNEELFKASGTPACRGHAQGLAAVVVDQNDLHRVQSGSILVTAMTTPDYITVANRISGLITERGGLLCHAAILAREFNIPCIVGCDNATKTIKDGERIRMDAISGVVMGVS